ncbi:hypothetical protein ACHQM5_018197 [Ranunculus cassubicifolius]
MSLCVLTCIFFFSSSLSATAYEKVKVDVYYDTLSPASSDFILNDLERIFKNGLFGIVDLKLIPYGNAKLADGKILCQHGEECTLNMLEACAIHAWPDVVTHFKLLHCFQYSFTHAKDYSLWDRCYEYFDLNQSRLALHYANETNIILPRPSLLPWVVIDGIPLEEDYINFMHVICEASRSNKKPIACNNSPPAIGAYGPPISATTLRRSMFVDATSNICFSLPIN